MPRAKTKAAAFQTPRRINFLHTSGQGNPFLDSDRRFTVVHFKSTPVASKRDLKKLAGGAK